MARSKASSKLVPTRVEAVDVLKRRLLISVEAARRIVQHVTDAGVAAICTAGGRDDDDSDETLIATVHASRLAAADAERRGLKEELPRRRRLDTLLQRNRSKSRRPLTS